MLAIGMGVVLMMAPGIAAADYPEREIRIICPAKQGGSLDRMARAVQKFLPEVLGKSVVVENTGISKIAIQKTLAAPADGHTILVHQQPFISNELEKAPNLMKLTDIQMINMNWIGKTMLVAHKELGWKNVEDMIIAARKNPGKYVLGMGGLRGTGTLLAKMLFKDLNLDIKLAPYKSGGKARTAVRGRHVDMTSGAQEGMKSIEDVITPLGMFSDKSSALWPKVPTVNEQIVKYNVKVPNLAAWRLFAVKKGFKEKNSQAFNKLVNAFKTLQTEHKDYAEMCRKMKIGREWYGPEKSDRLYLESHDIYKASKGQ